MFIVFFISLAAAYLVAKLYIPLANVGWDESVCLHWAYQIYYALKTVDILNFVHLTFTQFDYPPLQSWTIGIPLSLFGFSVSAARFLNLFWFISGSLLLYLIGQTFGKKLGRITGFVGSLFFLTSPLMLLHAGLVVKEMMGAALTLATLYIYILARKNNRPIFYLGVSLFLIALFLTKYNYGILATFAIFLEAVVNLFSSKKRLAVVRNHFFVFVPFISTATLWLLSSTDRLSRFIFIITNRTAYTLGLTDSPGYLLFYPRTIALMYSSSVIIGLALLFSILLALFYLRDYRIRLLWFSIIPNLILGTIHTGNMQERYLFTSIAPLFLLGAYIYTNLFKQLISRLKSKIIFSLVFAVILIMGIKIAVDLFRLPQYVYTVGAYTQKNPFFNQPDYVDLWFNYDTSKWSKKLPLPASEKPSDVVEFIDSQIDLSKPVNIIGRANEYAPDYFNLIFALHREKNDYPRLPHQSYVVTLEVLPNSRYYTRDFVIQNSFIVREIKEVENDPSFKLFIKKTFSSLGVAVGIYTK